VVLCVFVWLATGEVIALGRLRGHHPSGRLAQLAALALVLVPYVACNLRPRPAPGAESWGLFVLAVTLALAFYLQARRYGTHDVTANVAITMLAALYVGGLASFLVRLRLELGGRAGLLLVILTLLATKLTDVGAYAAGRACGRRPLIPWLSPNKTWEGLIGGLLAALLAAVGFGYWFYAAGWIRLPGGPGTALGLLMVFGLLIGPLSVAGDLAASLLKRDAAIKDSSQALPGLGGLLDVADSPLLTAPAAWLFWTRLVGPGG
jgi:phosphatidate cytidylyltransferase